MQRRKFITLFGTSAVAWPLAARAQQPAMPVVGYLYTGALEGNAVTETFRKGLAEAGLIEGRNVTIEYRFASNDTARLPELAADLVRRRVVVIAAPGGATSVIAAKAATSTIPIVFATGVDPVQVGLVPNLNHPGGNVTGFSALLVELGAKQLGILHELMPHAARFGVLDNPTSANAGSFTRDVQAAAAKLGHQVDVYLAASNRDINSAFAAGGLMSYSPRNLDAYRQVGAYTGRILKGEKPADLPVVQPTRFEFVINLNTAKALGLDIPAKLLALSDEVIE